MYSKTIISSLLLFTIILTFSTVSLAQNSDFEGQVKINGEQEGTEYEIEYLLKGEKMRMEVQQPNKMVLISDEEDMIMLMPENKQYMTFPKDQLERMQQMIGSGQTSGTEELIDEDMELQKTGETKEVLGRDCELWVYEDEDKKVETWVTSGFRNFMGFTSPLEGGNADAWTGLFGNPDLFPMEMTQWDKDGNEMSKFRITRMEEKSLSNDLFTPPSDYGKMNIMDGYK